jgi:hypothetical protein
MKYSVLLPLLLLAACSRDTSDAGPRAAAAVAAIALQSEEYKELREQYALQQASQPAISPAASAPIELDYQMPNSAPAGQSLGIELVLNTPLADGEMTVAVAEQIGVTLLGAAIQSIDLSRAARPVRVPLQIMPGAAVQRSLLVTVSVEADGRRQSRNFTINLPRAAKLE